jgi:hypothetical protein
MAEDKSGEREDSHETVRHEFFRFSQANGKENHQKDQHHRGQNLAEVGVKDGPGAAKNQDARKNSRHDEGDFAAGLEETDKTADKQQHDINPEHQRWKWHIHQAAFCLIHPHSQAQNFAWLALGDDLERAAANFAIRGKGLRWDARIDDDFKTLSAK